MLPYLESLLPTRTKVSPGIPKHILVIQYTKELESMSSSEKYFDLSAYNSTEFKRIESSYARVKEDFQAYLINSLILASFSLPLNIFLIVQILRFSHRRTAINGLIATSSISALGATLLSITILISSTIFCTSTFLIMPSYLLWQKLLLSALAVARHMYVYSKNLIYQNSALAMFLGTFLPSFLISAIPLSTTVTLEDHPLWATCELINVKEDSKYLFLLTFFIIIWNSFLVDLICYVRILNFMRKNSVRVTVVATSHTERIKAHNIVTAPSSLLIWLVESVMILPSCLLMIKSSASLDADHIITLLNFQQGTLFGINVLIPLLYIGSSAELRKDVGLLKKYICHQVMKIEEVQQSSHNREVYTISDSMPQLMLETHVYS